MITFTLFRQYLALLRKRNLNIRDSLSQSKVTDHQIDDPNCRMSTQQHDDLWDSLLKTIPKPQLALNNNDTLAPASFSSLMYLAMSHQQALEALETLLNLKNQDSAIKIQLIKTHTTITLSFNKPLFELKHWHYFLLLSAQHIIDVLSWLKNEAVSPIEIQLPANIDLSFAEFLQDHSALIKVNQELPKMVFDINDLQFSLTGSHPQVRAMLEQQAQSELSQYQSQRNILDELTGYLLQCFHGGLELESLQSALTLDKAAQHFFITSRTLQRKIKQHNKSFSKVLDEVRALRYKSAIEQGLSGERLAEFCGFSHYSAIQRFVSRLNLH